MSKGCAVHCYAWLRVYVALLHPLGVPSLVRLAYFLGEIIAPPRRVETYLTEQWLVDVGLSPASRVMLNMNLLRGLPKAGGGCSSSGAQTTIVPSLAAAPIAVDPASAHSPSTVQEIPPKEVTRKVPESSGKR
ncbi:hypothetical protein BHM03_00056170 [Ensete ventricosum]|nr:hypothetical protein BHM03_00056170 [Ensete ventricosum]